MNLDLGDTRALIAECKKQGVTREQCAYVLATSYWETARKMKPVREMGGERYLKSKKYYPYVGMGYVQLTWDYNYKKASKKLGVDFMASPRLLLERQFAIPICVTGMREGWFTGKKLSDYINYDKCDFVNARRIINGVDKKKEIASIALEYLVALSDYDRSFPIPKPRPEPPVAQLPVIPDEVHEVLEDQDKGFFASTSNMATVAQAGAGAVGTAGSVLGFIESPWVQALLLVLIAGGAFWLLRERSRKAQQARVAKAAL